MDRRRFLLTSVAGALVTPLVVEAQQAERVYQVGLVSIGGDAATWRAQYKPFLDRLSDLGYAEGKNLVIRPAFADGMSQSEAIH